MLLASKIGVYVKSVHKAIAEDKSVFPLAGPLGLSRSSATAALASLDASRIASGCVRIGRKMISCQLASEDSDAEFASLGYLYDRDVVHSEDSTSEIRAPRKNKVLVAPRLTVRVHGSFTEATTFERFSEMLDAVGLGLEILSIPFKENSWLGEDEICSNGFGFKQVIGPMKGLSRASRKNFDHILAHSTFSFSCVNKKGSQLRGFAVGGARQASPLNALYAACRDVYRTQGDVALCDGDLLEFKPLCVPMSSSAGDEWIVSPAGIQLDTLRVRLVG